MAVLPRLLVSAVAAGVGLGVYACSSGTTTGLTPITGIVVRSDSLVEGHGCGTGPDQIYEYAVVVSTSLLDGGVDAASDPTASDVFIAGGTFPCYADGTFVNLCASPNGSYVYDVQVYAFTQAQWASVGGQAIGALNPQPDSYCTYDAGGASQATFIQNVNNAAVHAQKGLAQLASFTADCTATQQSNIEVVAVCSALSPVAP